MLLVDDFISGSGSLQVVTKAFIAPLREQGWPCVYLTSDMNLLGYALWGKKDPSLWEERKKYVLRLHRWVSDNLQSRVHLFLKEGFVILHSEADAALYKLFDPETTLKS